MEAFFEGLPVLDGGCGPLAGNSFFLDELVDVVEDGAGFGCSGGFCCWIAFSEGFSHFSLELFGRGDMVHLNGVAGEVGLEVEDVLVYLCGKGAFGVLVFLPGDSAVFPYVGAYAVADGRKESFLADDD